MSEFFRCQYFVNETALGRLLLDEAFAWRLCGMVNQVLPYVESFAALLELDAFLVIVWVRFAFLDFQC